MWEFPHLRFWTNFKKNLDFDFRFLKNFLLFRSIWVILDCIMQIEMGQQKKVAIDVFTDKRFYKRFRKNNLVKMVFGKNEILGNLEDMSMIGASISSREEILLGERVKFMSPLLSTEIEADIIRKDLVQETYKYGLMFHDLSDAVIAEILNKIASAD